MTDEPTKYVVTGIGISPTLHPSEDSANEHLAELALTKPWAQAKSATEADYLASSATESDPTAPVSAAGTD